MSNGSLPADTPAPRLCHIIQWQHFDGYGFNLHAEKGKPGQYIGKVDEGSPAEAAGLKQGDKIIEVNGTDISNENHKQVVQRIKAVANETKLLVVDTEAEKYYKANNITIKGSLPEVKYLKTPIPDDNLDEKKSGSTEDTNSLKSPNTDTSADKISGSSTSTTPSSNRKNGDGYSPELPVESMDENFESHRKISENNREASENGDGTVNGSINLSMTAKELRAKLASRKKYDPKKDTLDFKKKYEIVQTL